MRSTIKRNQPKTQIIQKKSKLKGQITKRMSSQSPIKHIALLNSS